MNEELLAKVKQAKTKEEALKILAEAGYEPTEEDLKAISGGGCCDMDIHPCDM